MARKPDAPCAGGCGKMLWSGRGALPAGKRTCHPCRRAGMGPVKTRVCSCGTTFRPQDRPERKQRTCSPRCGALARCGLTEDERRLRRRERNRYQEKLRNGMPTIGELGRRDNWRCHLCRRHVDWKLDHPHPMSASRDHLVPASAGGSNESANLALAHLQCNIRRGTGGNVQLLLVG